MTSNDNLPLSEQAFLARTPDDAVLVRVAVKGSILGVQLEPKAMRDNMVPPTLNLDKPSVQTAIDLVPHTAKKREINTVLSNSFGFGGTNATLVFRRLDA